MESPPAPAQAGQRLLIHLIDKRAKSGHHRPLFATPKSKRARDGFEDISYSQLANAINRAARWILEHVGPPTRPFEPLVLLASLDLRYQIFTMAAVKTGHMLFLPSPRNSAEAYDSLFDACDAQKLLSGGILSPHVEGTMKRRKMQQYTIPPLDDLLDTSEITPVLYEKTFDEARFDPFVAIHTSGSTGIPKLVILKHGAFCCLDGYQALEPNEIGQRLGSRRLLSPFPQFHAAGLLYQLALPIFVDSTVVCAPAVPLTADVVNDVYIHGGVDFSSLPPSIVVDLCKNPEYLANVARLKGLNYGGGPLSEATGAIVAKHTHLTTNIGTSEYLAACLLPKPSEDWAYFRFNEKGTGLEFRQQEGDSELYEMTFVRKPELDLVQSIFVTFPDLQTYSTKDLFSKHPTKPGLWKYVSRLDDILVMTSGENLNPVSMEGVITSSPDVKGCVIIGQARPHAVCLIEPQDSSVAPYSLIRKVWPFIEKANAGAIKHGRINQDAILLTSPEKPLPRAGKGTIQRAATNAVYAKEIELHYNQEGARASASSVVAIDLMSLDTTRQSLLKFLAKEADAHGLDVNDDLTDCGIDSLQFIALMRSINAARAKKSEEAIEVKQIYDNPTVEGLAQMLHANAVNTDEWDSDDDAQKEAWLDMDGIYNQYVSKVGRPRRTVTGFLQSVDGGPVFPTDRGLEAWLQILASFLINFNNFGLVQSFGVFQAYYESVLDESTLAISFVGTLQGALLLIVGFVSGPLFDAGYYELMLSTASIGLVFALMMLSLADKYWQIMLCQGVLLGLCSGLLYIPSVAIVPVYFKQRRGLALGVALSGGSFGGIIYPIVFRRLLVSRSLGFGWAVRILGFIALATLAVAVLIAKPIGSRTRRHMFDMTAFKDFPYCAFAVQAFCIYAAVLVPFFFAPSFAESKLHTGGDMSFYMLAILNAAQVFGRILPGWFIDLRTQLFGPEVLLFVAEISACICGFCWIAVENLGGFIPWSVIYGFFSGMIATLPAAVLPWLCPNLAMYGTRLGMIYACAGVGLLISTPAAAGANSSTGGFLGAQIWTGALSLGAALAMIPASKEARRKRLLYQRGRSRKHAFKRHV